MTLEQLMKSKGYTDQEIADMAPLLNNAKFRKDLEAELGRISTLETQQATMKKDMDEYDRWFTEEIGPQHEKLLKENADLAAEAAANKARMEAYQKATMRAQGGQPPVEKPPVTPPPDKGAEPNKDYITTQTFKEGFDQVGGAIAAAIDLTSDFMQLFPGQHLNMEAMRNEAKAAKKTVREYVESKYNFAAKRQEIANKAKADEEAKIRADERQKLMVEFGSSNPNTAVMRPSNSPFVERKKADGAKQPWERNPNELSRDRIEKAIKSATARGEVATA